ncbi:MAG TPA: carboxypeptidase-like regulatory domain-containing protein, partial [Segetibacter sp.]
MKHLLYAFVLTLILSAGEVFAQERVVTGRVTDTIGGPVANASVVIKGARNGTQTSADGAFSLRVPATATTLTISSIGFGSQDVA